jgi:hypothetical protein
MQAAAVVVVSHLLEKRLERVALAAAELVVMIFHQQQE